MYYCITCRKYHNTCKTCSKCVNCLNNTHKYIFQCCDNCHKNTFKSSKTSIYNKNKFILETPLSIKYPRWKQHTLIYLFMLSKRYLPVELWNKIFGYIRLSEIGRPYPYHSCIKNDDTTYTKCYKCKKWHKYEEGNILTVMENYKETPELAKQIIYIICFLSNVDVFKNYHVFNNKMIKEYIYENNFYRSTRTFNIYKNEILKRL
jgi:hypothetical protein